MTDVTIRDRDRLARTPAHAVALDCLTTGIEAALPETLLADAVSVDDRTGTVRVEGVDGAVGEYPLREYDRAFLVGAGKAAAGTAAALVDALSHANAPDDASAPDDANAPDGPSAIDAGIVVTDEPTVSSSSASPAPVEVLPGDHPLPSERGVESTRRLLDLAEGAGPNDLVLAVVTGGGSALLAAPADPLSVADLRAVTTGLLACGASIGEINAVRKHCSAVKGGRLARAAAPATVVTLAISDVVGDPLDTIGSGPTVPDPSTYADALAVFDRYDLDVPGAVRDHLRTGAAGDREETPVAGDPAFDRADAFVVGNGRTALDAAAIAAAEHGYEPVVLASGVRGESREAAATHAAIAEECALRGSPVTPPAVLLSGGETTVTLGDDPGLGGPNAEFAVSAALTLAEGPLDAGDDGADGDGDGADGGRDDAGGDRDRAVGAGIVVASVDTDGIDGPTDAAGAVADATTLNPDTAREALDRRDVYPVLDEADALLRTGPTGTNVNDLRVIVVPGDET